MSVFKCARMGCLNPVARSGDVCTECETSTVGGGRFR